LDVLNKEWRSIGEKVREGGTARSVEPSYWLSAHQRRWEGGGGKNGKKIISDPPPKKKIPVGRKLQKPVEKI